MDPLEDGSVSLDFSEVSTPVCLKSGILNLQLGVLLLQVLGLLPLGIQRGLESQLLLVVTFLQPPLLGVAAVIPSVTGLVAGGGVPLHVPSPSIGSLSNQRGHRAPRADRASVPRRTSGNEDGLVVLSLGHGAELHGVVSLDVQVHLP